VTAPTVVVMSEDTYNAIRAIYADAAADAEHRARILAAAEAAAWAEWLFAVEAGLDDRALQQTLTTKP
jgi:hypothetical protein